MKRMPTTVYVAWINEGTHDEYLAAAESLDGLAPDDLGDKVRAGAYALKESFVLTTEVKVGKK